MMQCYLLVSQLAVACTVGSNDVKQDQLLSVGHIRCPGVSDAYQILQRLNRYFRHKEV